MMLIMLVIGLKENKPVETVSFLGRIWYPGLAKDKQLLKRQLEDYQINANSIPTYCHNTAAICLSKNPILHSKAKHIEIKHHFIRDYVEKGILDIQFIDIEHQWADIFTKPLIMEIFDFIKKNLNMHFVFD